MTKQIHTKNPLAREAQNIRLSVAVRRGRCGSDPRLVPEFIRKQTLASSDCTREE